MAVDLHFSAGARVGGEFRIIKPLNAGGMGAVYVAEQETTGKLRALKLMHRELFADAKLRERFEQEARVGSMIPSDHIVQVIGAGVDQATGVPWLAMELLEGEDLAANVAARGPIPPSEVLDRFEQICHGLGAAHAAGVVHRDMKPENIFLAKTRSTTNPVSVKILDFGIARVTAEAKTAATAAIGTPLWMAPEQSDPRAPITPRADVWSLGLIAFTMLTGRVFWRTAGDPLAAMTAVMREILFEPIPPASRRAGELGYRGSLPEGFDAWFARCMAREPSARFGDASEAIRAMRPALTSALIEITGSGGGEHLLAAADGSMDTQAFLSLASAPTSVAPLSSAPTVAATTGESSHGAVKSSTTGAVSLMASAAGTNAAAETVGLSREGADRRRDRSRTAAMILAGVLAAGGVAAALVVTRPKTPPAVEVMASPQTSAERGSEVQAEPPPSETPPSVSNAPASGAPGSVEAPASASASASAASAVSTVASAVPGASGAPTARRAAPPSSANAAAAANAAGPFDMGAAQNSVQQLVFAAKVVCAPMFGPRTIAATVFFEPSGSVRRVTVDMAAVSSATGMCVQTHLSRARVRPFKGDAQASVSAVVVINEPFH